MGKQVSVTRRAQRETAWRHRLARHAASTLTVEAFCRREAVPVGTFYGWQARLRARDADVAPVPQTALALSASPFVDLGPINRLSANAAMSGRDHAPSNLDVRLELGGGVVLHIVRR